MLEILKYITSSFWVFVGSLIFSVSIIAITGWAINAILIGIRGIKCDEVTIL